MPHDRSRDPALHRPAPDRPAPDRPAPDRPATSDHTVRAATGRDWSDWFEALDTLGARNEDHKAIVALTRDRLGLTHAWWQQTVTVAYEKVRGLRAPVGETADAGFQLRAQRTVAASADAVWSWVTTHPERWLGPCKHLPLAARSSFVCLDGTEVEVRSVVPGTRLRLTWRPERFARPSTLQLTLTPKGP
ncbi:MAG: hypothetical protein WD336_10090, partial [Trueperaceae bacterium]